MKSGVGIRKERGVLVEVLFITLAVFVLGISIFAMHPRPRKEYRQRAGVLAPTDVPQAVERLAVTTPRVVHAARQAVPEHFAATLVTAFEGCSSPMRLETIARRARRIDRGMRGVPLEAFAERLESFRRNHIVGVRQGVNGPLYISHQLL